VRFINLEGKEPDEPWRIKAKALSDQLDAATTKAERDKLIDDNSAVWGELKPWLLGFSKGKCWFSEARDTFNHWDVEHYRPKKVSKNLDGTDRGEGYWWLAFDWHNFRICGTSVIGRKEDSFRSGTELIRQLPQIGIPTTSVHTCLTQPDPMTPALVFR